MILFYFFTLLILSLTQYYVVVLSSDIELKILFERLIFKVIYLTILILLFYIALNKDIGTRNNDTANYVKAFQLMSDSIYDYGSSQYRLLINSLYFEPLYVLIMQFWYSSIDNDSLYFVSIFTIVGIILTFNFFKQNSRLYWVAILLYSSHFLWVKDFNQLRNSLASAILWYLPDAWVKRQYFKFYSLLLIAILIQSASIFILIALVINKYTSKYIITRKQFITALIICILLYFLNIGGFLLQNVFAKLSTHVAAYLFIANEVADRGLITNPVVIKGVLFSILFVSYRKELLNIKPNNVIYTNLYIIGVLWIVVFSNVGIFANRFASYLTGFENLLIAEVLIVKKNTLFLVLILLMAIGQFYVDFSAVLVPQV